MELATERLRLRDFVEDDWRAIFAIESIPEVVRFSAHAVRNADESRAFIAERMALAREVPRMVVDLAITVGGQMIGRTGIRRMEEEPRIAMLWFALAPAEQGKGYATEAARAVLRHAFVDLELHRVYGECDPRNEASARVLAKLGMQREGHHRDNIWLKGEWCDTLVFGMLARDYVA